MYMLIILLLLLLLFVLFLLIDRSKVSGINGERRDCQLLIGLIRLLGGN